MVHPGVGTASAGFPEVGPGTGPDCRLLDAFRPELRRAVQRVHLRAPLVTQEELHQELLANFLYASRGGRAKTAPALLRDAKSQLIAWALAENAFRALPRCLDAGQPAPSAEDAWITSQSAAAEAAAQPRRSSRTTAAQLRRNING
jgi:hypothetical protein